MPDIPPGIPIHITMVLIDTASKSEIVHALAIYINTTGKEIWSRILYAIFHVSSSCTVHDKCKPVCLLYGNYGNIIPTKIITQIK